MNRRAFSLIELLAVIVILAVVAIISTPIIIGVIKDTEIRSRENSVNGLMEAVRLTYVESTAAIPFVLPITATIDVDGTITIKDGNNIEQTVKYAGEKPSSGTIRMDKDGNFIATSITYPDGYICSMGKSEHGCTKNRVTFTDTNYVSDPDEPTRMIFYGVEAKNHIELKEIIDGKEEDVLYRIISVETDGTIKVMRKLPLKSSGSYVRIPYDSNDTGTSSGITGPRQLSSGTYCNYTDNGKYLGCNAWGKMSGVVNGYSDKTVIIDSGINTYLNTTFYNTLAKKTQKIIVSHEYKLAKVLYNSNNGSGLSITNLYTDGLTANTWIGKVGLIEVRDWFLATSASKGDAPTCKPSISNGGGYWKNITPQPNYSCKDDNYMYLNGMPWWTISPSSGKSRVYYIGDTGCVGNDNAFASRFVRPVFYLSPNIELFGEGTSEKPYKITN